MKFTHRHKSLFELGDVVKVSQKPQPRYIHKGSNSKITIFHGKWLKENNGIGTITQIDKYAPVLFVSFSSGEGWYLVSNPILCKFM